MGDIVDRFFDQSEEALEAQSAVRPDPPGIEPLVERLKRKYRGRITGELVVPARSRQLRRSSADLDHRLASALRARGIERLYSHQRQAWDAIRSGRHTVVVTPTASGKTLCYNLPVLQAALEATSEGALSLSHEGAVRRTRSRRCSSSTRPAISACAPTPSTATRRAMHAIAVRTTGDIVVSNPDMLHVGILPHHTKWAQFFENLRYVVIDEMHTYRGVFGSHRGQRAPAAEAHLRASTACSPTFILCSATIANPRELAQQLIGDAGHRDHRERRAAGREASAAVEPAGASIPTSGCALRRVRRRRASRGSRSSPGSKTIVFANSRLMVEVLTKYLKDVFDRDPRKPARVARLPRRLPADASGARPRGKLRAGDVDCVIATSALELGVDIGGARRVHPERLSGHHRRHLAAARPRRAAQPRGARRAGGHQRAARTSTSCAIPEFFLGASPEHARIAPDQLLILHRSRALRRVRAAVSRWRGVRRREPGRAAGLPRRAGRRASRRRRAGTGSPTATRRTR